MTDSQLNSIIRSIRALPDDCMEQARLILSTATSKIYYYNKQENCGGIKFTEKELDKMPKTFKKEYKINGCTARVYKRQSGKKKKTFNYVIRYRRNGYNVSGSSNNLEEAKRKFIERMREFEAYGENAPTAIPKRFEDFANYYFENFHKRKVNEGTYRIALSQFKNHVKPHFGNIELKKITPRQCQILLDALSASGKGKTTDDVHSLLNTIFKAAVRHSVMNNNPIDMVFHKKHQRQHGTALTKAEEKLLLDTFAGTELQLMFAVALYTGMRPNEYETAKLDGKFIVAKNSKRKNGKVEYKKIPITPMLEPYLNGVTVIEFSSLRIIRDRFNKLFSNHKLYDLRTTFYTRCRECGVADAARDEFVGHSSGVLADTYTDLSDEYLLKEGQKFKY